VITKPRKRTSFCPQGFVAVIKSGGCRAASLFRADEEESGEAFMSTGRAATVLSTMGGPNFGTDSFGAPQTRTAAKNWI